MLMSLLSLFHFSRSEGEKKNHPCHCFSAISPISLDQGHPDPGSQGEEELRFVRGYGQGQQGEGGHHRADPRHHRRHLRRVPVFQGEGGRP